MTPEQLSDAMRAMGAGYLDEIVDEAVRMLRAALGPVPAGIRSAYLRVVTRGADGTTRALNHFNKHAKGDLVRALATSRPRIATARGLIDWAGAAGLDVRAGAEGELDLVV